MKKAILVIILILSLLFIFKKDNKVLESKEENLNKILAYYIEDESGSYKEIETNTWDKYMYVFNEDLSYCENGSKLAWNNITKKINLNINKSDRCYIYYDKIKTMEDVCSIREKLTECLTKLNSQYPSYEKTGLIKHDSNSADEMVREYGIGNDDLRYSGDNPNNFVCFGPGAEDYSNGGKNCPVENLYRIIGLVDVPDQEQKLIKLIQSEYATKEQLGEDTPGGNYIYPNDYANIARVQKTKPDYGFLWNKETNIWSDGSYNYWEKEENGTIKKASINEALNDNYISYLKNNNDNLTWVDKIEKVKWNVRGGRSQEINNAKGKSVYEQEMKIAIDNQIEEEIGLIYVHDYAFTSDKKNWNSKLYPDYNSDSNRQNNWLFNGVYEWTILRYYLMTGNGYSIGKNGQVNSGEIKNNLFAVRPTFYLTEDIQYAGGNGNALTPYKINI